MSRAWIWMRFRRYPQNRGPRTHCEEEGGEAHSVKHKDKGSRSFDWLPFSVSWNMESKLVYPICHKEVVEKPLNLFIRYAIIKLK